jgi:hypothetical protein
MNACLKELINLQKPNDTTGKFSTVFVGPCIYLQPVYQIETKENPLSRDGE